MAEQYVPTTEEIRDYVSIGGEPRPWLPLPPAEDEARAGAFDRWLAAHDRQVAERAGAQALRDAADRIADGALVSVVGYGDVVHTAPEHWLRHEAALIEGGEGFTVDERDANPAAIDPAGWCDWCRPREAR
jgi:hypothetical protein